MHRKGDIGQGMQIERVEEAPDRVLLAEAIDLEQGLGGCLSRFGWFRYGLDHDAS